MKCSQPLTRVVLLLLLTLTSASCNINQARPKQDKISAKKSTKEDQESLAQAKKREKLIQDNLALIQKIQSFLQKNSQAAASVQVPLEELFRQENSEAILKALGGIVLENKDVREEGLSLIESVYDKFRYKHFLTVLKILDQVLVQQDNSDSVREKGLHILENVSENLKYEHFLAVLQILDQVLDKQDNSDSVRSHAEDMIKWFDGFLAWMSYFKEHDKKNYDEAQKIILRRLPNPQQA